MMPGSNVTVTFTPQGSAAPTKEQTEIRGALFLQIVKCFPLLSLPLFSRFVTKLSVFLQIWLTSETERGKAGLFGSYFEKQDALREAQQERLRKELALKREAQLRKLPAKGAPRALSSR